MSSTFILDRYPGGNRLRLYSFPSINAIELQWEHSDDGHPLTWVTHSAGMDLHPSLDVTADVRPAIIHLKRTKIGIVRLDCFMHASTPRVYPLNEPMFAVQCPYGVYSRWWRYPRRMNLKGFNRWMSYRCVPWCPVCSDNLAIRQGQQSVLTPGSPKLKAFIFGGNEPEDASAIEGPELGPDYDFAQAYLGGPEPEPCKIWRPPYPPDHPWVDDSNFLPTVSNWDRWLNGMGVMDSQPVGAHRELSAMHRHRMLEPLCDGYAIRWSRREYHKLLKESYLDIPWAA